MPERQTWGNQDTGKGGTCLSALAPVKKVWRGNRVARRLRVFNLWPLHMGLGSCAGPLQSLSTATRFPRLAFPCIRDVTPFFVLSDQPISWALLAHPDLGPASRGPAEATGILSGLASSSCCPEIQRFALAFRCIRPQPVRRRFHLNCTTFRRKLQAKSKQIFNESRRKAGGGRSRMP